MLNSCLNKSCPDIRIFDARLSKENNGLFNRTLLVVLDSILNLSSQQPVERNFDFDKAGSSHGVYG